VSVYLVLIAGLCTSSSAAVLIRLCDAPSLVIAAYRLGISSLILIPLAAFRTPTGLRELLSSHCITVLGSGFCLAFHFSFWITSLAHTSVASSGLLVTTNPIFVGIGTWVLLKEPVGSRLAIGTMIALAGTILVTIGDHGAGNRALYGDALALAGAVTMSAHLLIGRRVRSTVSLLPYIAPVNTLAAFVVIGLCFIEGYSFSGYSPTTYILFAALAVGPQLIGHSSFNYALRHVSPSVIALFLLAEPVLSAAMAYIFLNELPPPLIYPGGTIILVGIGLAVRPNRDNVRPAA
jgi:drug/metabolite transporter (DMT)-like permease